MKTYLFTALLFLFGTVTSAHADSIYEYIEALDKNFSAVRKHKVIQISAKPRLFEEDFARFVQESLDKKMTPKKMRTTWIAKQIELKKDGYVFYITYDLLDQNLDSGISITFGPDLPRVITLENNLGETAVMYKYTGDKVSTLDFLHTKRKMICYFNTKTEQGNNLIRRGVTVVKLKVGKFSAQLPEFEFVWNVPLFYMNTKRPREIMARFGSKPLRTLKPYKPQVYKSRKSRVPVVSVKRKPEKTTQVKK